MPNLHQKKNGDHIIRKNTQRVTSAPPVSTFQVDPLAVKILLEMDLDDNNYIDNETFWTLYDIGLLTTNDEDYDPSPPSDVSLDGLTGLEGFTISDQARFLTKLLQTHTIEELAASDPVLDIITGLDRVLVSEASGMFTSAKINGVLQDDLERLLAPTPFDIEVVFETTERFAGDQTDSQASEFGGPILWTLFLNSFYYGLRESTDIVSDIRESTKDALHFRLNHYIVATTSETWYFVGPQEALNAVPDPIIHHLCPSYDSQDLFSTPIPELVKAQLHRWLPSNGKSVCSLGEILTTGYDEHFGYPIILPAIDTDDIPELTINTQSIVSKP